MVEIEESSVMDWDMAQALEHVIGPEQGLGDLLTSSQISVTFLCYELVPNPKFPSFANK